MDKDLMKQRVNEVIKTDATVVELQDFMATHVPFKKLKYYTSGIDAVKGKELNEEDFFYEFIDNTKDKHNFIVVQGDNGSGKSHFIRWVKNKIESEGSFPNDIVILLERSQNTLQATINQLVNNEIIQSFLSEEEKVKLKNTGVELSEEKFTSMINYNFIIEAENEEDDEDCILKSSQRKGLVELLKDEIIQRNVLFNESGSIKRISNKLISSDDNSINEIDIRFRGEDFTLNSDILNELKESDANKKALRFAENLRDDKRGIRDKVATYLNSKMDTVIQRTIKLNAADLNSILEKIRIKLKEINKNLILFIEDITAFTGVDKGVIESLIVEHREDNGLCRIFSIIGVTTGYYQSHFPDNLKDRVTGRVFIDKDSLFDNDNDVLELAARYINAINIKKDELRKWIASGAVDSELPIQKSKKKWDIYVDRSKREFALYPLSQQAILNLYNEIEDKRTPRRFIKNVLLPILLHYVNDKNFPEGLSEFEAELTIPKFKNELLNQRIDSSIDNEYERNRTKCLLRIWGNGTIDCSNIGNIKYIGNVDERIFDEFKVLKIQGNIVSNTKENNSIINTSEKKPFLTKLPSNEGKTEESPINDGNNESKAISSKLNAFNLMKEEISNWFLKSTSLKMNKKIRTEIISFIKEAIDWDLEEVSMYLVNEALILNNLKIRGQQSTDEIGKNIIWIEKTEEDYYFLLSLMKYVVIGNKTWNYENAQDDILVLTKWLESNKKRIINYVQNGDDVNYSIYEYAMCSEIYSVAINKKVEVNNKHININEIQPNQLYSFIVSTLEVRRESELRTILGEKFAKSYYDNRELINENHRFITEFYNIPLGKGKGIFFDASKILSTINRINTVKYNISKFETLSFNKSTKELWKRPHELLKKFYGGNLEKALLERIKDFDVKNKNYIENFEDIGVINNLFEILEINNIHYDGKVKLDFENLFDDTIKYERYIKNKKSIENFNKLNLIDKIYLLSTSMPQNFLHVCDVLEKVESIITSQEIKYNNRTDIGITISDDINKITNDCLLQIEKMDKSLKEVKEALEC